MSPSSCRAPTKPGTIIRQTIARILPVLSVLLSPILPALAAGECDVCQRPPAPTSVPAVVDSTEAGTCDVCPKPESRDDTGASAVPGTTIRDCADCPELVAIAPSGLAANNVVGFALSTADITFGAWDACVAAGPCPPADDNGRGRGTNPVTKVDRHDARLYTAWLTGRTGWRYRLPTAAEWEYATRTGIAAMPAPGAGTFRVVRDLLP